MDTPQLHLEGARATSTLCHPAPAKRLHRMARGALDAAQLLHDIAHASA